MRTFALSSALSLALGLFMMPVAFAVNDSTAAGSNTNSSATANQNYRVPIYDKMDFSAEAGGEGKVHMKWSSFPGHNDEKFAYYKVIRSHSNPNPVYPQDQAIAALSGLGDLRFTDMNASKSAFYRVCAITNIKGRHCSNVVWVEIKKTGPIDTHTGAVKPCTNYAADGSCEKYSSSDAQQNTATGSSTGSAVECVNVSSTGECEDGAAGRQDWEAKMKAEREEMEVKRAAEKEAWEKQQAQRKAEMEQKKEAQKAKMAADREARKDEVWKRLYEKLDAWLERFMDRLENSDMTNAAKVEKIEQIQQRFYAWEKDNEMRMRIVDHLDQTLNRWKQEYSQNTDFDDVENFLEGLLD